MIINDDDELAAHHNIYLSLSLPFFGLDCDDRLSPHHLNTHWPLRRSMADSGLHVRGHSPTLSLQQIKERLIFVNKNDRNMPFPTMLLRMVRVLRVGMGKILSFTVH